MTYTLRSVVMPTDAESNSKAKAMLERAVQLDPGFCSVLAGLGRPLL